MPLVPSLPDQPPDAKHEVASVEDQMSVEASPIATPLGFDDRLMVGAGAPPGIFAGGSAAEDLHAHKVAIIAHTIANRLTL